MSGGFPVFRAFARGYLHEDLAVEHGSPVAALEAFLAEARPATRRALATEAKRLLEHTGDWPLGRLRSLLADELGAAWWPGRTSEVRRLFARAAQASSAPGTR